MCLPTLNTIEELGRNRFVMPVIHEKAYRQLVTAALPHLIHTEEENEQYIAELQTLHNREWLTPEEEQLGELTNLSLRSGYRFRISRGFLPFHSSGAIQSLPYNG